MGLPIQKETVTVSHSLVKSLETFSTAVWETKYPHISEKLRKRQPPVPRKRPRKPRRSCQASKSRSKANDNESAHHRGGGTRGAGGLVEDFDDGVAGRCVESAFDVTDLE